MHKPLDQTISDIISTQAGPIVLGIGGGECSGKTYITSQIKESFEEKEFDVLVLPVDAYLKFSRKERYKYNPDSKDVPELAKYIGDHPGCFDFYQLGEDLQIVLEKHILENPRRYDYEKGEVVRDQVTLQIRNNKSAIIVEGIFALHQKIAELLQSKIFICANDNVTWQRYLARHKKRGKNDETIKDTFERMVLPSYHAFIEHTAKYADYICHNNNGLIAFYESIFKEPALHKTHVQRNSTNTQESGIYRVFLAYNEEKISNWINNKAKELAKEEGINLVSCEPGSAVRNPAEDVRSRIEEAEGLIAILRHGSDWVSNEIGMAYALHLPICAIVDEEISISGILNLITEYKKTKTSDPDKFSKVCKEMFSVLKTEIESDRDKLPEPPHKESSTIKVSWWKYYQLIQTAYKRIEKQDPDDFQQGYAPTLLLGITRGGIIAADILSRLSSDREIGLLQAKRRHLYGQVLYDDEPIKTLLKMHCQHQKSTQKELS